MKFLPFIFCLLLTYKVFSQADQDDSPKIIPPSPIAYELGKYGQVPIGYFTGTANSSVPLFNYKAGELSVPVSLSYNSNGIKVDELETNVGLGWSLNIGGVISRIVRDEPDENDHHLYPAGDIREEGIYSIIGMDYFINAANEGVDSENDLFMYNFDGFSGKFMYNNNKKIVLLKQQDLKISPFENEDGASGFEILTSDGVKYIFSKIETTHYFKELFDSKEIKQENPPVITAWYLTQIIHPNGDQVNFLYQWYGYEYYGSISQIYEKSYNLMNDCGEVNCGGPINDIKTYKNRSVISGYKIKQITSNNPINGSIIIEYNQPHPNINNYNLISNVRLLSGTIEIENISFNYLQTTHHRLFLEKLIFKDTTKQFKFDYIDPESLCERLSFSQDYWGYYNHKSNSYFVPKMDNSIFEGSPWHGDRTADNEYSQKGLLKKITYPTKGYSEFTYEPNNYWGARIIYPPRDELSIDIATDDDEVIRLTDTISTSQIQINHEAFIYASVLYNIYGNNCNGDPIWDIQATVSIKNTSTNEYINLYKFSQTNGWISVGQFHTIHEDDNFELKADFQQGNRYLVTLEVKKPCIRASLALSYLSGDTTLIFENIETGGSRIKKIENMDPVTNKKNATSYYYNKYEDKNKSSGEPGTQGSFMYKRINRKPCTIPCQYIDCEYFVLGSESQIPLINSGGNNIYYRYVTTSFGGDNFEGGGQTNEFIIHRDVPGNPILEFGFPQNGSCYSNIGWDNGLEKSVEIFKVSNGNKTLLSKKNNFFTNDPRKRDTSYAYSISKNFDLQCTTPHHHICTESETQRRKKRVHCSNQNHNHKWWIPGRPFDGSNDPICMAWGAQNYTYYEDHPCYGSDVGDTLTYDDMISNLNIIAYINFSYWSYLDSTSLVEYDSNGNNPLFTYQKFYYDNENHLQLTRTIKDDSKGVATVYNNWYPEDYNDIENYMTLIDKHIISSPVRSEIYKGNNIVSGEIIKYNNIGLPIEKYHYENSSLMNKPDHDPNTVTTIPSYYNKRLNLKYDSITNKLIEYNLIDNKPISIIWGYNFTKPISETNNANVEDSGYTGFENEESNSFTSVGTWTFNDVIEGVKTGKSSALVYGQLGPQAQFNVGDLALNHCGYKASVWVKGSSTAKISIIPSTGTPVSISNTDTPMNEWKLLEVELPKINYESNIGSNFSITVSTSSTGNAYFDDLRFLPMDAEMKTYTYNLLVGVTSESDAKNASTTYEYDQFGRLVIIRDHENNILKKYEYNYAQ